jgi:hypothetical protein
MESNCIWFGLPTVFVVPVFDMNQSTSSGHSGHKVLTKNRKCKFVMNKEVFFFT